MVSKERRLVYELSTTVASFNKKTTQQLLFNGFSLELNDDGMEDKLRQYSCLQLRFQGCFRFTQCACLFNVHFPRGAFKFKIRFIKPFNFCYSWQSDESLVVVELVFSNFLTCMVYKMVHLSEEGSRMSVVQQVWCKALIQVLASFDFRVAVNRFVRNLS